MRVLVTGATGLVGNNVTRALIERGHRPRVLIRANSDPRPLEGLDVEVYTGDVRDAASVRAAVDSMDCLVHAAAVVHIGWTRATEHHAVNVAGTKNVAEAALEHHVRMIHVSTTDTVGVGTFSTPSGEDAVYAGNPPCPYPITKRAAEQAVTDLCAKGLNAAIVNPSYMLGPFDWKPSSGRMLLAVAQGRTYFSPPGGGTFCDVRDVAAGVLAAIDRAVVGRRYILGGTFMRYRDAWRIMAEITGGRRPICNVGPINRWVAGAAGDLWAKITGREGDVNSAAIRMASLPKHFSSQRAINELGYDTRPFRQTISDAWAWFKQNGYA
jgi:dihydroflavonol-4-reductase